MSRQAVQLLMEFCQRGRAWVGFGQTGFFQLFGELQTLGEIPAVEQAGEAIHDVVG